MSVHPGRSIAEVLQIGKEDFCDHQNNHASTLES